MEHLKHHRRHPLTKSDLSLFKGLKQHNIDTEKSSESDSDSDPEAVFYPECATSRAHRYRPRYYDDVEDEEEESYYSDSTPSSHDPPPRDLLGARGRRGGYFPPPQFRPPAPQQHGAASSQRRHQLRRSDSLDRLYGIDFHSGSSSSRSRRVSAHRLSQHERRRDYEYDSRKPTCGVQMRDRSRGGVARGFAPPPPLLHDYRLSRMSSSTDQTGTTNDDDDGSGDYLDEVEYAVPHKPQRAPHGLSMIEEISAIAPDPDAQGPHLFQNDEDGDDSVPPLLALSADVAQWPRHQWRPKHTSTMIGAPAFKSVPKTNPRTTPAGTPQRKRLLVHNYDEVIMREQRKDAEATARRNSKLYDVPHLLPPTQQQSTRPRRAIRPEEFGMYSQYAKKLGTEGVVYLSVSLSRSQLEVYIDKAAYFTEMAAPQKTTFIRLDIIHRERDHGGNSSSRKRSSVRRLASTQRQFTRRIQGSDEPKFNEYFHFKIGKENERDLLTLTVYEEELMHGSQIRRRMFGCMTFPLSRLLYRALSGLTEQDENRALVTAKEDWFFLLPQASGERTHLSMEKACAKCVRHTYYDIPSLSGTSGCASTSSSSVNVAASPQKMLRSSDWVGGGSSASGGGAPPLMPSRSASAIPHSTSLGGAGGSAGILQQMPAGRGSVRTRHTSAAQFDSSTSYEDSSNSRRLLEVADHYHQLHQHRFSEWTTASSSNCSQDDVSREDGDFGGSGGGRLQHHRMTLPAITLPPALTNSDLSSETEGSGVFSGDAAFNPSLLHVDGEAPPKTNGIDKEGKKSTHRGELSSSLSGSGVRRAASFTYSPTGSLSKHNRRPPAASLAEDAAAGKKKTSGFGPISKTLSYIRSKMESTSSLYPSKDEVRQWETSFDALLQSKLGQQQFMQFLRTEFSFENLEFWQEVEEYKKMKEGKKASIQKAQDIFREFIDQRAPKEINLDSDTRSATKAALEKGARPDTFNLAQTRIEQLMAKDSYRRFLKHPIYLDLLNSFSCDGKSSNGGVAKENGDTVSHSHSTVHHVPSSPRQTKPASNSAPVTLTQPSLAPRPVVSPVPSK